ncbi:MAG TPA: hypothetical protein EYQ42_00780 [Thiotrichaceae bacterium]|jgi:hypothetical protein|nr:hypothetical protein [Thiotrichaceae bacterium]HIM07433.1 hypothetical protein [Gammaproteobacteria bacterium]
MYKFDNNNEEEAKITTPAMQSLNETSKDVLSIVVRICGLLLLFIGLWIAIQVFSEALALYKDPTNIERMATAIEAGSNIDKSIDPIQESLLGEDEVTADAEENVNANTKINGNGIRLSYFIAWVVDLLLLLLLARIALATIKTGGELALYDEQIKKFAKQLINANK